MSGDFNRCRLYPFPPGFQLLMLQGSESPLAERARGTQLFSLEVFLFSKNASYDQHLISARVPEDSR